MRTVIEESQMNSPWVQSEFICDSRFHNAEVINLDFLSMKCSEIEVIFVFVLNLPV